MPANFQMQVEWFNAQDDIFSTVTPIVGNLNPGQDTLPEIVVFTYALAQATREMLIFKGDGSDSNNPPRMTISTFAREPAIADLDRDGNPELFFIGSDQRIRIYHGFNPASTPPMQLWITSTDLVANGYNVVYPADFDGDGMSELYAGNEVYALDLSNPAAPQLNRIVKGAGPYGRINSDLCSPFAADLLTPADCNGDPDCAGLEIAAGYAIYSIDLDPNDGDGVQIKIQRNINTTSGQGFTDGFTAVADLDLDGTPEVVTACARNGQFGILAWNKTGFWRFMPSTNPTPGDHPGVLSISNVYDDTQQGYAQDWPEIVNTNNFWIGCYNMHAAMANPASPLWWTMPTDDILGYGGVSSFDFNNDGVQELVARNEASLRILYGGAGPFPPGVGTDRTLAYLNMYPVTGFEFPVIADVDGDNQAEIITTVIDGNGGPTDPNYGILNVIGCKSTGHHTWMPARDVWNQYAYNVVNINDDLTVPIAQQQGHLEMPAAGSGKRPMNNFSFQAPKYGRADEAYLPTPDISMELVSNVCHGATFTLTLRICNQGGVPFKDSLFISWYRFGNPFSGNAVRGGTLLARTTPLMPDSCMIFVTDLPFSPVTFNLVANDAGNTAIPLPFDLAFPVQECDYQNNRVQFGLFPPPTLNLGPDRSGCPPGGHLLVSSNGFSTYLWQDGSTGPTFTATLPGTYWLQATDNCANTRRDSVRVVSDASMQQINAKVCPGTSYTFNGIPIPPDSTHVFKYTKPSGCDSTIVVQVTAWTIDSTFETRNICAGDSTLVFGNSVSTAGVFSQTFVNTNGCDSVHTITVGVFPAPVPSSETRMICAGDSTLVFGNYVSTAGVFSQAFPDVNGCDSLHSVTVSVFPAPVPSSETRMICAGDSTLVFGNYISSAGVFSQIFPVVNGCDSTHTITVMVFPAPVPTTETRAICAGDSTLVFGNYVSTAGVFSQIFPDVNGCDSTHTITVSIFPSPVPTTETRAICAGDSTLVFGNYVSTAGMFSQIFPNVNGCDSTHTITVSVFPAPVPTGETRTICAGDSTLVFGNYVSTAGVFSQIFPDINGCDSTHTITVSVFPAPVPTSETRAICAGDSTLVFGNYVSTAGVFSQIFPDVNSCDSTHTITVSVFPASVPTAEMRSICAGDSTLVFGNYVSMAGVFSQIFPNVNGCDSLHTIKVSVFPAPVPTSEMRTICAGDSTLVFGNYVFTAGVFSQTFTNLNGCDSLHTVTVGVFPAPVPTSETRTICAGDSTLVFGNYVSTSGVFTQSFPDINGCDSTHTIMVERLSPEISNLQLTQPGCLDSLGTVAFSLSGPDVMTSLDGIAFGQDTIFQGLQAGAYTLFLEQGICRDTVSFELSTVAPPQVFLQPDTTLVSGQAMLLQPQVQPAQMALFEWSPSQGLSCDRCPMPLARPLSNTTYQLMVTDSAGCSATASIAIQVIAPAVYAPNVFSPEGSGANAYFTLYANPLVVEKLDWLQVYDRWGSLVFERRDFLPNAPEQGWDGRFRGQWAEPGVYTWLARIHYRNGTTEDKTGDVLLPR